ncbi:MAG TPA: hypothetical protein DCL18_03795 [Prevotella sp.]|nr:hypothetical protein [Prevotella sp.]
MFSIWVMTAVAETAERLGGIVVLVQFMGSFIMWSVGTMRISIALISATKLMIIFNNVSVFLIFFYDNCVSLPCQNDNHDGQNENKYDRNGWYISRYHRSRQGDDRIDNH